MSIQIAPSILSADFSNLGLEVERIARTADWVHIDVMDNHFVPNLTLGLPIVESLVKAAAVPLDCHLMIDDPDRWAPGYVEVGARSVTFHVEAARDPVRLARTLRSLGARVGLAVKPDTPLDGLRHLLPEIDTLLLMTVEPGFGGQEFLERVLPKIRQARQLLRQHQPSIWLQVDGGISETTIERAASAGADVFVAGSAVYRSEDPNGVIERLRSLAVDASR